MFIIKNNNENTFKGQSPKDKKDESYSVHLIQM